MLVTLKSILRLAEADNKAIGAFNVTTLEGIRAVIAAAEETGQPVILQFANAAHSGYIRMKRKCRSACIWITVPTWRKCMRRWSWASRVS